MPNYLVNRFYMWEKGIKGKEINSKTLYEKRLLIHLLGLFSRSKG